MTGRKPLSCPPRARLLFQGNPHIILELLTVWFSGILRATCGCSLHGRCIAVLASLSRARSQRSSDVNDSGRPAQVLLRRQLQATAEVLSRRVDITFDGVMPIAIQEHFPQDCWPLASRSRSREEYGRRAATLPQHQGRIPLQHATHPDLKSPVWGGRVMTPTHRLQIPQNAAQSLLEPWSGAWNEV